MQPADDRRHPPASGEQGRDSLFFNVIMPYQSAQIAAHMNRFLENATAASTVGGLIWLSFNAPHIYRITRNAMGIGTFSALAFFALVPMAPPRVSVAAPPNLWDAYCAVAQRDPQLRVARGARELRVHRRSPWRRAARPARTHGVRR